MLRALRPQLCRSIGTIVRTMVTTSFPLHMRAVTRQRDGGPEVLEVTDLPVPTLRSSDVLVHVVASSVNRADTLQRRGLYPPPKGESEVLGLEMAGIVAKVGDSVTHWKLGDRVCGIVASGGNAEYCAIHEGQCIRVPERLSLVDAAGIAEVFLTADRTIFTIGELVQGEKILIHAGSSGVGSAGIQMASAAGATVFTTAGSSTKIQRCKELGCAEGINYRETDFATEIDRITHGEGVDVVEDFLGASYLASNLKVLKPHGRLVIVGLMGGRKAEIDLNVVLSKHLRISGSVMRAVPTKEKTAITQRFVDRWYSSLEDGRINPIIDCVFPLEEVADAHRRMEANAHFGKIILRLREE